MHCTCSMAISALAMCRERMTALVNVLMTAAEVVVAVQQECKELERKGWKRESSERHHYERRQLLEVTPPSGSEVF